MQCEDEVPNRAREQPNYRMSAPPASLPVASALDLPDETTATAQDFLEAFRVFDTDGSGKLSVDTIVAILTRQEQGGTPLTAADALRAVAQATHDDGDGGVSYEALVRLWMPRVPSSSPESEGSAATATKGSIYEALVRLWTPRVPSSPPESEGGSATATEGSRMQTYELEVPAGASEGDRLKCSLPGGFKVVLTIPAGAEPGTVLAFDLDLAEPPPPPTPWEALYLAEVGRIKAGLWEVICA